MPDPGDLPGCTDQGPGFSSAPTDSTLAPGSVCIDAGDNFALPAGA